LADRDLGCRIGQSGRTWLGAAARKAALHPCCKVISAHMACCGAALGGCPEFRGTSVAVR